MGGSHGFPPPPPHSLTRYHWPGRREGRDQGEEGGEGRDRGEEGGGGAELETAHIGNTSTQHTLTPQ